MGEGGVEDAGEGVAAFVGDGYEIYAVFPEEGGEIVGYAALAYLGRLAAECREMLGAIFYQCGHALGG